MQASKNLLVLFCAFFAGCSALPTASDRAAKIQIHKQSSALIANCKKLGPADATVGAVEMAQLVYNAAVAQARDNTAAMGGDSMVLLDSDHAISGLTNTVTVHAIALRCY